MNNIYDMMRTEKAYVDVDFAACELKHITEHFAQNNDLYYTQEGFGDTVKKGAKKVVEFIKKIIAKIKELCRKALDFFRKSDDEAKKLEEKVEEAVEVLNGYVGAPQDGNTEATGLFATVGELAELLGLPEVKDDNGETITDATGLFDAVKDNAVAAAANAGAISNLDARLTALDKEDGKIASIEVSLSDLEDRITALDEDESGRVAVAEKEIADAEAEIAQLQDELAKAKKKSDDNADDKEQGVPVNVNTLREMIDMANYLGMDPKEYFGDVKLDDSSFKSSY